MSTKDIKTTSSEEQNTTAAVAAAKTVTAEAANETPAAESAEETPEEVHLDPVNHNGVRHIGRAEQTWIYFGKLVRMFIYENDWKVLPMAALIAGVVSFVIGSTIFKTMEGLKMGSLALACICLWNGFFNSIQVVCRERSIVKRDHRAGMHISSYVAAHMIFQALICAAQVVITILVLKATGVNLVHDPIVTPWFLLDLGITLFLATYASDMMALFISSVSRTTTAAMTIMPFLLIVELVFSGSVFALKGQAAQIENFAITKWAIRAICSVGRYNELPLVTIWNQIFSYRNIEIDGMQPVKMFTDALEQNNQVHDFEMLTAQNKVVEAYAATADNILNCWMYLGIFVVLFAVLSVLVLELIDRDKR